MTQAADQEAGATLAPPEEETLERTDDQLAPRWRVICHDDPVTTMEFVVQILRGVFGLSEARAHQVMMRAHAKGSATVGRWPEGEARAKVERAMARARAAGFPLTFTAEPD
jgi:ATP-dependent Clp protease adaptor protein ClpS